MAYTVISCEGAGVSNIGAVATVRSWTIGTLQTVGLDRSITVHAGDTLNVTTHGYSGTSGHLTTLISSTAGTAWNISTPSGTVSVDFVSLKDSAATGGAAFYAGANSTNVSGNTGWIFTAPPVTKGGTAMLMGVG
jgi:hypothetical protein